MPDPSGATTVALLVAATGAGWIDAVVGGGGLVQLPALVVAFPHALPVQILATNKLGSICGTSTSSLTYYRRVHPDLRTAVPLALVAFGGAFGGALVGSHIPKSAFNPLILVVLLAVGAYTLLSPRLGAETRLRFSGREHLLAAMGAGAVIGFYDGALGPGTGSFFTFALVGLLGYGFLQASAKAKIANFATNLAALAVFVPQGAVLWRTGLLMGLCNLAGAYAGARTAVAKGSAFVRVVFVVVVGAFAVKIGRDVLLQLLSRATGRSTRAPTAPYPGCRDSPDPDAACCCNNVCKVRGPQEGGGAPRLVGRVGPVSPVSPVVSRRAVPWSGLPAR